MERYVVIFIFLSLMGCGSSGSDSNTLEVDAFDDQILGAWKPSNGCVQPESGYLGENFTYIELTLEFEDRNTLYYRYQGYDDDSCLESNDENLSIEIAYTTGETTITDEGVEAIEWDLQPVTSFTINESTNDVKYVELELNSTKQIYLIDQEALYLGHRPAGGIRPTSINYDLPYYRQNN